MIDVNDLPNFLERYCEGVKYNGQKVKDSIITCSDEIFEDLSELIQLGLANRAKVPPKLAFFIKDLVGSGLWVGHNYIQYLKCFIDLNRYKNDLLDNEIHKLIIDSVRENKPILDKNITVDDIFRSVFIEINHSFIDLTFRPRVDVPNIDCTIVLVPGVFNELFRTAPFERGTQYVQGKFDIKYIVSKVSGIKSSKVNSKTLFNELSDFIEKNLGEKLWLMAYSKGGLDSLHFLKKYPDFAHKNIIGLSTIASPIIGSEHTEHRFLRALNKIYELPFFQSIDKGKDLLAFEFRKSLSSKFQGMWFRRNYKYLPDSLFYTAMALESEFRESHFWMMLAKLFFPTSKGNDGVVNVEWAKFPEYFPALNFGTITGHHLSGSRSSSFNQEALIKTHLVVLDYFGKLPRYEKPN